jgi:hypothetical protein
LDGADCGDLDWSDLESFAEEGLVCPAAATAKQENIKTARKILFMLDLTVLKLLYRT